MNAGSLSGTNRNRPARCTRTRLISSKTNANRRTAPVWGAPRPPTSLGGRFTPQRGAWFRGANNNLCVPTPISSTRNIKPDIEMAPACVAAPEPLVPPRARNQLCERAVEQASKSCRHCGICKVESKESCRLETPVAAFRRSLLTISHVLPLPAVRFARHDLINVAQSVDFSSQRGRNARNRSRQREYGNGNSADRLGKKLGHAHCGGGLPSNLISHFLTMEACSIATIWPFICESSAAVCLSPLTRKAAGQKMTTAAAVVH
jgi:hypothetical protein